MTTLRFLLILALLPSGLSIAQEPKDNPSTKLIFKTEWKGERIALPPEFAPKMKLKDRKSTRLNSSHALISYAVFCLKKKIRTPVTH